MARSNAVSGSIRATSLLVLLTIGAAGCSDDPTAPEEVTAIGWQATARQVEGGINDRLVSSVWRAVRPGLSGATVSIPTTLPSAGVHAGVITMAAGGRVTIELRPGQDTYTASARNGIITRSYSVWPRSFIVR